MIVNHKARILLTGNRKCGSTTLNALFGSYQEMPLKGFILDKHNSAVAYGRTAFSSALTRLLYKTYPKHYNLHQWRYVFERLGHNLDEYAKVVFIRNPWDRMVSDYHWRFGSKTVATSTLRSNFELFLQQRPQLMRYSLSWYTGVFDGNYVACNIHIFKLEMIRPLQLDTLR